MDKRQIFLTAAALCLNMSISAQSVNLQNVTVKQALNKLQQTCGYSFVYEAKDLNTSKRVSVNASNCAEAIGQVLRGQGVTYTLKGKNVIISKASVKHQGAQQVGNQRRVKGVIKDGNGEPIIGATVRVKGHESNGTISDLDGNFSLEVSPGDELEVSYVGYSTKLIKTGNSSSLSVIMKEDNKSLEEIVVVGYGTQKKVSVTGSMASTKGDDLAAVPTPNITNTLAGRLPGLISYNRSGEPGYDDAGLLIRGASTIGNASPLLVVDGVADRAGSLGRLDPNDIESITILKDASAAIYGSRAANGVILVTTKRGSKGDLKVQYTGNVGVSSPTILPEMCNSWQYAELLNEITPGKYSPEEIQKFKDGSDPLNYPNIDAFDLMLKPAVQTQHNVSASGGGKTVSYYVSLGYQYQDNYYKNSASNYNQYNLRSNIDITPSDLLKFSVNVAFRQEDRNSPVTGSEDIWRYLIKYNPMVNVWYPGSNYGTVSSKQDNFAPATGMDDTMGYQRDRRSYLNADLTMHLEMPWLAKGLSADAGFYVDRSDVFYKNFQKKFYLYSYENNDYVPVQQGQNVLSENMHQTLGITMNARINYKRTFNLVHNVSAFVAWEQYKSRYDYLSGRRQDFVSTSIDELFAGDSNSATNDGTASETARLNYFGRVDYDYAGKYLFQFNWRYDGSENFPKGNRFGFFPGVSMGWRISEEKFWKEHIKWMD